MTVAINVCIQSRDNQHLVTAVINTWYTSMSTSYHQTFAAWSYKTLNNIYIIMAAILI